MQGFNYSQLYQALQDWPVQASTQYLQNIDRLIFAAERRVLVDLNLDIFDVMDTTPTALSVGQNTLAKPSGSTPITFTANLAQGAIGASLTSAWTGLTGQYTVTFQDTNDGYSQWRLVTLTNGSVVAGWTGSPLTAAANYTAMLNPNFIVERSLWVVYSGAQLPIQKRSRDWVYSYAGASNGQPRFYCDSSTSAWRFAPAADANATGILRLYLQRPTSIVVAGNTFLGDNVGDLLFTAALMEAEGFIKNDDRYVDMRNKYGELLPNARTELMAAWRTGDAGPLQPAPGIALPAPPPPPMPNGAQPT